MIVPIVALLISLIGLIAYVVSNNGKVQGLGLYAFAVGLLAFLMRWDGHL